MLVRLMIADEDTATRLVTDLVEQGIVQEAWTQRIHNHVARNERGTLVTRSNYVAIDCLVRNAADVRDIGLRMDELDWVDGQRVDKGRVTFHVLTEG